MDKLFEGIREFQSSYFSKNQELFQQLALGQTPRVLFVTCSDSRIDPNLIVQAGPGELFVIRNAGNIVPPFGAANGGEGASIEYAIGALNIEQVVICGHNHCGAMKGLLKIETLKEKLPLVYDWLRHAEATRQVLKDGFSDLEGESLIDKAVEENTIVQMDNLKTYPLVRSRLQQGKLTIYCWVYEIETGAVKSYNTETGEFEYPQTRLPTPGSIAPAIHGTFVTTSAPPVPDAVGGSVCPIIPPPARSSSDKGNNTAGSWLPPEQSSRIYGGSRRN
jgi:carbonic anhydrase